MRQELTQRLTKEKSKGELKHSLASALNTILNGSVIPEDIRQELKLSQNTMTLSNSAVCSNIEANRHIIEEAFAPHIQFRQNSMQNPAHPDITILDAIRSEEHTSELQSRPHLV